MQKLEHKYGANIKIADDNFLQHVLGQLCSPEVFQPQINELVATLYRSLFQWMVSEELAFTLVQKPTRMTEFHPQCQLNVPQPDINQKAVVVNLVRAGTWPSHLVYELLHQVLPAQNLRQDHIFASRLTDMQEHVTGTQISGAKIGGGIEQSLVIVPDPMGATGNTIVSLLNYYKKSLPGPAKAFVALHLIVTPEYLAKVSQAHPDLKVYALRVDRGLSNPEVLKTTPGEKWSLEKGLNDKDYIVPGGGGFGEIMNNSFV